MQLIPRGAPAALAALLAACGGGAPPARPAITEPAGESTAVAPEVPPAATPPVVDAGPSGLPAPADVAAPPAGAAVSPGGVSYLVLQAAPAGAIHPTVADTIEVHYTGWTTDGKMFDSSRERGAPNEFPLGGLIPGWQDVVPLMAVGDRWRVWIPEALAYAGKPDRPAGMLVFDIDLLAVKVAPPPPPVPADVAAPPKSAKRTKSGLRYRYLAPEVKNGPRPALTDTVRVHYSGWTTDGQMFDSSITRGRPADLPVDMVVPGFQEGLQLMHVGERVRLWIPEKLAYGGVRGAPAGMLVFDVELLEINPPAAEAEEP